MNSTIDRAYTTTTDRTAGAYNPSARRASDQAAVERLTAAPAPASGPWEQELRSRVVVSNRTRTTAAEAPFRCYEPRFYARAKLRKEFLAAGEALHFTLWGALPLTLEAGSDESFEAAAAAIAAPVVAAGLSAREALPLMRRAGVAALRYAALNLAAQPADDDEYDYERAAVASAAAGAAAAALVQALARYEQLYEIEIDEGV